MTNQELGSKMRDAENAVRYFDPGDIPLPKEVLDYHREKLAGRAKKEGRELSFDMVVHDLQFASILPKRREAST